MTRNDFTPGMQVRVSTRETPRRILCVGTVREPEGPMAEGTWVLVAMPPVDGVRTGNWWFAPEQLEPCQPPPAGGS